MEPGPQPAFHSCSQSKQFRVAHPQCGIEMDSLLPQIQLSQLSLTCFGMQACSILLTPALSFYICSLGPRAICLRGILRPRSAAVSNPGDANNL